MYIQRVQQYSKLNRIQTHFEVTVMKYKMMEEKCKIKVINCQGERNIVYTNEKRSFASPATLDPFPTA